MRKTFKNKKKEKVIPIDKINAQIVKLSASLSFVKTTITSTKNSFARLAELFIMRVDLRSFLCGKVLNGLLLNRIPLTYPPRTKQIIYSN